MVWIYFPLVEFLCDLWGCRPAISLCCIMCLEIVWGFSLTMDNRVTGRTPAVHGRKERVWSPQNQALDGNERQRRGERERETLPLQAHHPRSAPTPG